MIVAVQKSLYLERTDWKPRPLIREKAWLRVCTEDTTA